VLANIARKEEDKHRNGQEEQQRGEFCVVKFWDFFIFYKQTVSTYINVEVHPFSKDSW
jgi:hypothetical protein